jgi:phosphohistidine phosphatase
MRGLLLLRHAKSDWHADYGDDRARPLNRRGQKAAKAIGRFLTQSDQLPDAAVTSPAVRAADTLRLAMEAGGLDCPVRTASGLYGAGVSGLVAEIRKEPIATEVLLAVGHEPTWSEAATAFIGGGHLRFPTAALARIDFDVERWKDVAPDTGVLAWLVTPRILG